MKTELKSDKVLNAERLIKGGYKVELRDHFAGLAMQAIGVNNSNKWIANRAYEIADAMLKERDKK